MKDLEWTKEEIEIAIMSRLVPLKASGLEVDSEIVAKEMASYTYDLAKLAYNKGIEAALGEKHV
jgi:hypothetical protein